MKKITQGNLLKALMKERSELQINLERLEKDNTMYKQLLRQKEDIIELQDYALKAREDNLKYIADFEKCCRGIVLGDPDYMED